MATLMINELFGGELLLAEVHRGGERTGYHWWNRLGSVEIDLTRDQFFDDEVVGPPDVIEPRPGRHLYSDQLDVFRGRVLAAVSAS